MEVAYGVKRKIKKLGLVNSIPKMPTSQGELNEKQSEVNYVLCVVFREQELVCILPHSDPDHILIPIVIQTLKRLFFVPRSIGSRYD